ncbi:MAG: 4-hydroxy-tetrahydrodipicolinate reductase [Bacillota bacterium]
MSAVRIALLGAGGRMGQTLLQAADGQKDLRITAALVREGSSLLGQDGHGLQYSNDISAALRGADVLLDFSMPAGTEAALAACLAAKKPLVTGVTGLSGDFKGRLRDAGRSIAVLSAPNMSLGVALLAHMAKQAAEVLGADFDVEISEVHHRHKKDAPSGTALALGEAVAEGRKTAAPEGRTRGSGMREPGSIGYASVRAGDIVGEHTVLFAGAGERLELTHRAQSRLTFAHGALNAARWIAGRPAGAYSLVDILGG